MSPEMLTLVAAVLAYPDMVREMWEARSSKVEVETEGAGPGRRALFASRRLSSWTRLEKDILKLVNCGAAALCELSW